MGKRRNTAKTGDKALYKSRNDASNSRNDDADDDAMYNEVERYHNAVDQLKDDVLRFDGNDDDDSSDGDGGNENVFDLELSDDDDDDDSGSEDDQARGKDMEEDEDEDGSEGDDSDEESDSDVDDVVLSSDDDLDDIREQSKIDVLNWGKKKKDYYHGDTADLEIGQEVEDAELEEEAGKEVLEMRLKDMKEDDFMPEFDDDSDDEKKDGKDDGQSMEKAMQSTKMKNLSKLSKKEKRKILEQNHPELLPLISHFRDEFIRPCAEETLVVKDAMFQNEVDARAVGATPSGLNYLITKAMIQTSAALNVCQYLLLKSENVKSQSADVEMADMLGGDEDPITSHPVISRLNELNNISTKLETGVEKKIPGLNSQIEKLVEASKLMASETADNASVDEDNNEINESEENVMTKETSAMGEEELSTNVIDENLDDEDLESSDDDMDMVQQQKQMMNEARFALRPEDDMYSQETTDGARRQRRPVPSFSDYGEDDDVDADRVNAAGRSLASTMNTISQRSNKSKSGMKPEEDSEMMDDRFQRGLDMMDADLGADSEDDGEGVDNELDNSLDGSDNDFYSKIKKRSKDKKAFKKSLYEVAPKYPTMDLEIEGERPVGHKIMKNRGLVAHKNKLNRNPRVKKREQYRKALIRRRGAVRDIRTDEGHKYGGEETGIKSGVSRSRKLNA